MCVYMCIHIFIYAYIAFRIPFRGSWYVIPSQGFFKLKSPVWVPVRAQQDGYGIVRRAAATHHSFSAALCTCTRVSCTPILAD